MFNARRLFDAPDGGSILCWGKFAYATWKSIQSELDPSIPHLVISPREALPAVLTPKGQNGGVLLGAEHPLPGPGSFDAGARLLSFFSSLRRFESAGLTVFLSGGSSSLAWLPRDARPREQLLRELEGLYKKPWSIQKLNQARTRLCGLKGGGAANWLRRSAPDVYKKTRIIVVSDVAPFGPEVIGSGPFWDRHLRHEVVADNRIWVERLAQKARPIAPILLTRSADLGRWTEWVERIGGEIECSLKTHREGFMIFGGEPSVDLKLPRGAKPGHGGRQSQIALALLLRFHAEILEGRLELLCGSTDGVDGRSRSSGTQLNREVARKFSRLPTTRALRALETLDSGSLLASMSALLPEKPGGVNVQDAVLVRVKKTGPRFP